MGPRLLYGTGIVVAEDPCRLAQEAVEVRELDFVTAVGKTEPSRLFEQQVAFLRANPPAAGRQGVWQATEK